MIKAVFITNIPSPYRVDFFAYLQKHYPEYEFHIIFRGGHGEPEMECGTGGTEPLPFLKIKDTDYPQAF